MEVFIKDEEINRIHIITDKFQNGNAIKIGSAIDDYIGCKNAEYSALFKSLDQHDAEIRADERKKVIAELREWVKDKSYKVLEPPTDNEEEFKYVYDYEASSKFSLEEKLTELEKK